MKASKMPGQSVCAVIVTYHPSAAVREVVPSVLGQVQGLVVVDNGSNADEVDPLRAASQALGFQLIENGENLGIAEALNQGVRWARKQGYPWVIFFDQDSNITDGFVREMFAAWEGHAARDRVASIHPRYKDPESGVEMVVTHDSDGEPLLPMTSGSIMPIWIFEKVGWFASEYFIDVVDWEYCFRIRAAGFLVIEARSAFLLHAPGKPTKSTLWGHTFVQTHHSAMRRYYITRNRFVFCRKYFRLFPGWIINSAYAQFKETIACLLVEENRASKFRSILLGTWDALTGKMGKRQGL
ncbi:MAG: glycosyltransferase family 2 protein [Candidatus Sulfotelmatobacter sp.]